MRLAMGAGLLLRATCLIIASFAAVPTGPLAPREKGEPP
jgi:hypothetical protein